jgi:DNA-binding transcriptional regulator YhcF (GntR family)
MVSKTFTDFASAKHDSKTPKYQQLVNFLMNDIEKGSLTIGERLPSINEASEECYLSRDTVERAYTELHRIGVVTSIFRKGYFIAGKPARTKTKVFFLTGKITENNKAIFNAFLSVMGKDVTIDIFTYNYKSDNFCDLLNAHLGNYHYYVIMPHLIDENIENLKGLRKITGERLVLLDQNFPSLGNNHSYILSNSKGDLRKVLTENVRFMRKYQQINLVLTDEEYFDADLISDFRDFCEANRFEYQVLDGLEDEELQKGQLYLIMDDHDLVSAIKSIEAQGLVLGKEVGIVSMNDSCYKEVLAGGISVISSQPESIGKTIASVLKEGKKQQTTIPMQMVARKSI